MYFIGLGRNQQNFQNVHVGGDFYNQIANVENDQSFTGVRVSGDFHNTVTGGKRNYLTFSINFFLCKLRIIFDFFSE